MCSFGDEIVFTQGSVEDLRFAAAFGKKGRIVGAITFNHGKWLEYYAEMIERSAPFPPPPPGYDVPSTRSRCRRASRIRASRPGFPMLFSPAMIRRRGAPSSAPKPANPSRKRVTMTTAETAWTEAMKYENRHDPYRFFDELRKTPVVQVADKDYVVTGYRELLTLAHDPARQLRHRRSPISATGGRRRTRRGAEHMEAYGREPSLIVSDPPKHDRQRRQVMRHFAPPHSPDVIPNMEADIQGLCDQLLER